MSLTVWIPVITFLLGAIVTFIIHNSTQQQTYKLSVAERKISLRDDRREVIYSLLDAVQEIEEMMDREYRDLQACKPSCITDDEKIMRQHRMWFQQKRIEVVGSKELKEKSRQYALTMERIIFRKPPPEVLRPSYRIWMNGDRETVNKAFLLQARNELYSPEIFEDKPRFWRLKWLLKRLGKFGRRVLTPGQ